MTENERALTLLACQEQIVSLMGLAEPTNPRKALLIEHFNAKGLDELDLDLLILQFIGELEIIQEQPDRLLEAHWFNRKALMHILKETFSENMLELLKSVEARDNLLLSLYLKENTGDNSIISLN